MATPNHGIGTNGLLSNSKVLADKPEEGSITGMKTVTALVFLAATLAGTSVAQMFTPACPMLKPITDLPPLGHPNATQQCVCESMNRGCHWAWVDSQDTIAPQTSNPPPYVNQFDQAVRDRIAAQRREKELREERQFIEEQNDHVNDLEIIKAVHDGVLLPVGPGDDTTLPTVRNSYGQEFSVVPPASDPTLTQAAPGSDQFTHGFFNGRKWITMSESDRTAYVVEYLRDYARSCLRAIKVAPRPPCTITQAGPDKAIANCGGRSDGTDAEKACSAKLGNPEGVVDGLDRVFSAPENRSLTIPVAIKAASMIASGESPDTVERYLESERQASDGSIRTEAYQPRGDGSESNHAAVSKSTDSDQYFTQGLLNGRMWVEMSEPDRVFYVAAFLQGYAISCLYSSDDAAAQKTCYAKLGDPAHTNPVDPHEIVDGVNAVFAALDNRGLIIPVAIKAASMKASGETQDEIEKYLQTERGALAGPLK
jgi:hypothetical protein